MGEEIDKLNSSLCIPSTANSYGIAIEYMRNWFLKQFDNEYWNTIYVDGKFVLDDFKKFNLHESIKKMKPMVAIVPQMTFEHDREKIDLYQGSLSQLINRSREDDVFIRDDAKNIHVSLMMEQLQMNFTYRMKVSSRAQQVELYKYIQMAFRIGSTQGEYIDIDFHIPYSLIMQLATDIGFEVVDGKIKNVVAFVHYLNSHSILPILYKYRNVNGKNEFFIRMSNMYAHISCLDQLSPDDGERENMIFSNFMIDMQVVLQMPMPKAYAYYSTVKHDTIKHIDKYQTGLPAVLSIQIIDTPDKNSKGWDKFIVTDYHEDDFTKTLSIDFAELFEDSNILRTIKHNNSIQISSSVFIDFIVYNVDRKLEYTIDWENLVLHTNTTVETARSSIVIYVDLQYVNDTMINLKQLYEDRLR